MNSEAFYSEVGVFSQKVAPKLAAVLTADAGVTGVDINFDVPQDEDKTIIVTIKVKVG